MSVLQIGKNGSTTVIGPAARLHQRAVVADAATRSRDRLDHLDLTVADIDARSISATNALRVSVETFGAGRKTLSFGNGKINLQARLGAGVRTQGVQTDAGFRRPLLHRHDAARGSHRASGSDGVRIEEGPVTRTGARDRSVDLHHDPDDNLIEISNYT